MGFTRGDYLGNWSPDEELRLPRPSVTANIEDVFAMLAAGRIDLFLGQALVGEYILRQVGLEQTIASFVVDRDGLSVPTGAGYVFQSC